MNKIAFVALITLMLIILMPPPSLKGKSPVGFNWFYIDNMNATGAVLQVDNNKDGRCSFFSSDVRDTLTRNELTLLVDWITGSFSSSAQADTSSDKYHVDVCLHMVQIWTERVDGYWLYVEQAYADDTGNPYRQRVYHLYLKNNYIHDDVYKLPNDSLFITGWETPELFDQLIPGSLIKKDGCSMVFEWQKDEVCFFATTNGEDCKAGIPGVAYITSDAWICQDKFMSWDKGFNETGEVVMGPYSPYVFDKKENFDITIMK